mgnify:CR=1 FL=1
MTKTLKPVLAMSVAALTLLAGCAKGDANTAWSKTKAELKKKQFQKWSNELNDKINTLPKTYRTNDEQKRIKNYQLKTELLKMTESYETLKDKFKHFEKHDELKL